MRNVTIIIGRVEKTTIPDDAIVDDYLGAGFPDEETANKYLGENSIFLTKEDKELGHSVLMLYDPWTDEIFKAFSEREVM